MSAKPFFRPAIAEVKSLGVETFIEKNSQKEIGDIEDIDELIRTLALCLERRVKEIITKKGLIDTGTMRASVSAVKGVDPSNLPSPDEIDPDATATVEVNT